LESIQVSYSPDGAEGLPSSGEKQNLYALVIYVPEPLGSFLDDLRREMAPGCTPHAHVSVLPPRPVGDEAGAISESREAVAQCAPFELELGSVEVFPLTSVIYISVARGSHELRRLHERLNRGALAFAEPFPYHPHSTLAQELDVSQVEPLRDLATKRWRSFQGPRTFRAEQAVFVQNVGANVWKDLAVVPLRAARVG
jgi:2'-5' RNA ligase superfamily